MTELLILLAVVLVLAVVLATLRDIYDDGAHTRRQPPTSHHPDMFDPRFRSA